MEIEMYSIEFLNVLMQNAPSTVLQTQSSEKSVVLFRKRSPYSYYIAHAYQSCYTV